MSYVRLTLGLIAGESESVSPEKWYVFAFEITCLNFMPSISLTIPGERKRDMELFRLLGRHREKRAASMLRFCG